MALSALQKKAQKLGIDYADKTDEVLTDLIEQKEKQIEQDKEEAKIKADAEKKAAAAKKKEIILQNIHGEDVDEKDYFFPGKDKDGKVTYAPSYFNRVCGLPVQREDMIEVFKKVFGEASNDLLFYKSYDKEVYLIIVPLKRAKFVGESEDSIGGDFQKHAISFIADGSVNLDTLKLKLRQIANFLKKNE